MSELGENGTKCSGISVLDIKIEKEITNGEAGAPGGGSMSALQTSWIAPPPPGAPPQPSAPPQPPPSETDTANGQIGKRNSPTDDEICKDYLRGVCSRKVCKYKHEPRNKALGKGTVNFCHDHQNKGCPRPYCKFIHCTDEEEKHFFLTGELPICKDFIIEECPRGSECMYRHETQNNSTPPKESFLSVEKVEVETTVPEENGVSAESVWNSPPPQIPPSMHCIPLPPHPPPTNPPAPPPLEQQPTGSISSEDITLPQLSVPPPSIVKTVPEVSSTFNHVNTEASFPVDQEQSFSISYDTTVPPPNMRPKSNVMYNSPNIPSNNHVSASSNPPVSKKRTMDDSKKHGCTTTNQFPSNSTNFVKDFEEKPLNSEIKTTMKPQYVFNNTMTNKESRITTPVLNSKTCQSCRDSEDRNRLMEKNIEDSTNQVIRLRNKIQFLREENRFLSATLSEIKNRNSNAVMEENASSRSNLINQFISIIKSGALGVQDSSSSQLNLPGSIPASYNSGSQMFNVTQLFGQLMAELQNSQSSQNTQSVRGQFNVNNQHQALNLNPYQQLLSTSQGVNQAHQQALMAVGNQQFNSHNQQMNNQMNNQQINSQQINLAQPTLLSQNQQVINEDNFYGNSTQHITAQLIQKNSQPRGNSSNSQSQNPMSYMTQNARQ